MDIRFPIIPILIIFVMCAVVIGIVIAVRSILKECKRDKVNGNGTEKKWYTFIILSVIIMFLSWIFNMGWYRVILTWVPLPLIHTIVFLLINIRAANNVSSLKSLRKYIILSCITYLLPYLLFPDGGDIGGMYLFFGLIRNDTIANIMMYVTPIIIIANITILIFEYLELRKCKFQ